MKTKERDCQDSICDMCGERSSNKEVWNVKYKEWDVICYECYAMDIEGEENFEYDLNFELVINL